MKSFKKALSLMLTALMLLSTFSICASAKTQTVKWTQYGDKVTYTKRETLKTGKNTFSYIGNSAHPFTAREQGLYSVTLSVTEKENCDGYSYYYSVSKKSTDTTATDFADVYNNEKYGDIYYFNADTTQYFGVCTEGDIKSYTLKITYLGKVTDAYVKNSEIPLQADYEISFSDNCLFFSRDIVFKTDSGKTVSIPNICVDTTKKSLNTGTDSAYLYLFGISKKLKFSVFYAQDEIKKITRAKGFETPTVYVDKSGELLSYEISEPSFMVNIILKDGTVLKNEGSSECEVKVTLSDKRVIVLFPMITMENGKAVYSFGIGENSLFSVTNAKTKLYSEEGEEEKLSLLDILKTLFTRFTELLKFFFALLPPRKF